MTSNTRLLTNQSLSQKLSLGAFAIAIKEGTGNWQRATGLYVREYLIQDSSQ
ncbi:hypothetical protein [Nostoc sp. 106C]|uniref:hypothetical protein n=1 Tax=Nostoc sp. 106C TaxID=1932667 RepID=UPI00141333DC|nr:hypothetical protein [Nostoc sp. 106C]